MPPVFGIIQSNLQKPDPSVLKRMLEKAQYQVARQIRQMEGKGCVLCAAIVHDATDYFFQKNHLAVVADAVLYNRKELINRLKSDDKQTDAALILAAYEKWGNRCVEYLYGDFAFVIFDSETGKVFCGRDPVGVRPLFYYGDKNLFVFSSELRIVKAALATEPELRKDYLVNTLAGVKEKKDKTPFENIFRLPPACFMEYHAGIKKISRYWKPDVKTTIDLENETDYVNMLRELLVQAVTIRCEGVNGLGAELSGGLDSTAICGIAADYMKSIDLPFSAFSNVLPENASHELKDEKSFIEEMLSFKDMKGFMVTDTGLSITDLIRHTVKIQGCFAQQNFSMLNHGLYHFAAKENIDILLSGFGGDEVVSSRMSFPWYEFIQKGNLGVIWNEIYAEGITFRSILKPFRIGMKYILHKIHPVKYYDLIPFQTLKQRFEKLAINPLFEGANHIEKRFRENFHFPKFDSIAERQLFKLQMNHVPQRLEYSYAAAAQFGLEYRYPLLDVRLILAFLSIPSKFKVHHGSNRYLFREAIRDIVPEKIRVRNEKAISTVPHSLTNLSLEKGNIEFMLKLAENTTDLERIFTFSKFRNWYEELVRNKESDRKILSAGLFYAYLQICEYYVSKENGDNRHEEHT
jgi:asparagine synthase (glutamine-hydrolysing)